MKDYRKAKKTMAVIVNNRRPPGRGPLQLRLRVQVLPERAPAYPGMSLARAPWCAGR